jgi:long-chain fatty acid transport protein
MRPLTADHCNCFTRARSAAPLLRRHPWLVAVLAPWVGVDVHALGFRIPNQDAAATARGNAFVATADNPSALYYNPAGISQLEGQQFQVGAHTISVNSDFSGPGGIEAESEFEVLPVPQIYYTHQPKGGPLTYGLGIYVPFGLGLEWPEDVSFRNVALEGRLNYTTVNPVVALQLIPSLSLAVGPTFNYAKVKLRQGLGLVPDDELYVQGDGFSTGFTAGILWQPHPQWSFGASYRSANSVDVDGHTTIKSVPPISGTVSTIAPLNFPQVVTAGVSFRPTPNWNVEVNVDWTDWDTLDTVSFEGTGRLLGADAQLPLNWESSWLYEFGVTRYLRNGWYVSTGYFFSQNSTSETYFNPVVPDTHLHVASLGIGHRGEQWSWAVSGQIITGAARTVDESVFAAANGDYQWFNQAVNVSVAYRF